MGDLRAVLFDMDGVLLDSEAFICKAGVEMFREKGYRVDPEDFKEFTGMGENRYLGGVAEKNDIPFELARDKSRTYEIYRDLVRGKLSLLPGVERFFQRCREKDLQMALASSADRIKIDINLLETGIPPDTFHTIVSGQDIVHKKPAPDIFILAASNLGIPPAGCLVVEDAISGVKAGKDAGCKVLALTTSFPEDQLKDADWIANDLSGADQLIWP
jgi:HAD superfamily hydrolase (TIGR01509 family)